MTDPPLPERLLTQITDDHERGCMGRNYGCSCGYDEKTEELLEEAAAEIRELTGSKNALQTEIERLRELDTATTKLCHSLDTEIERLQKTLQDNNHAYNIIYEQQLTEIKRLTLLDEIGKRQIELLRAERHSTKQMLEDVIRNHCVIKKDVD